MYSNSCTKDIAIHVPELSVKCLAIFYFIVSQISVEARLMSQDKVEARECKTIITFNK